MRALPLIVASAVLTGTLLAPSTSVAQTLDADPATDAAVATQLESRIINAIDRDRYVLTRRHKADESPYDAFGSAHPRVWGPWGGNYGLGWGGLSGWSGSGPLYQQQAVVARMTVDLTKSSTWKVTLRGPWMHRSTRVVSAHGGTTPQSRMRMTGR